MSKTLFAIALCAALAGCGPRQSGPETTVGDGLTTTCQYVNGNVACILNYDNGMVCYSYRSGMSCNHATTTQGQSK